MYGLKPTNQIVRPKQSRPFDRPREYSLSTFIWPDTTVRLTTESWEWIRDHLDFAAFRERCADPG
jgi:hypothetical protein